MWSRQSSTSTRLPATCAAQQGSTRSRGRTWASMGDLSGADAAVPRRRSATSTSTGSCPDVSEGAAAAPGDGRGVGMKLCMSGENWMASDGGDTDYADQTASEVRTRDASRVVDRRSGSTTRTFLHDFCDVAILLLLSRF